MAAVNAVEVADGHRTAAADLVGSLVVVDREDGHDALLARLPRGSPCRYHRDAAPGRPAKLPSQDPAISAEWGSLARLRAVRAGHAHHSQPPRGGRWTYSSKPTRTSGRRSRTRGGASSTAWR